MRLLVIAGSKATAEPTLRDLGFGSTDYTLVQRETDLVGHMRKRGVLVLDCAHLNPRFTELTTAARHRDMRLYPLGERC